MVLDSALPIRVTGTDVSRECESVLDRRDCALWVFYEITDVTDDLTFNSVAVACQGELPPGGAIQRKLLAARRRLPQDDYQARESREDAIHVGLRVQRCDDFRRGHQCRQQPRSLLVSFNA
jgi:hypothetical protein